MVCAIKIGSFYFKYDITTAFCFQQQLLLIFITAHAECIILSFVINFYFSRRLNISLLHMAHYKKNKKPKRKNDFRNLDSMKIKKVKISSHNKKTFICRPTVTTTSTFQMPGKKPFRTSFMVLACGKYFLLLLVNPILTHQGWI